MIKTCQRQSVFFVSPLARSLAHPIPRDYVYGRHRAPHVAAFGATIDGNLVGSNFATKLGSVGFFGPLTVRPDLQERGIAQALLARAMQQFDSWETRHVGLFTFPHSAKHIGLRGSVRQLMVRAFGRIAKRRHRRGASGGV
jgi:GNAT superfamily N-acetyltransferase